MTVVTFKWTGEYDVGVSIIGEYDTDQEFDSEYDVVQEFDSEFDAEQEDTWVGEYNPLYDWEGSS